ncbi:hypothetical protein TSUD_157190 [Trifolium subterraneum]|uniref:Inositol polyphosphate-related phosphatase domain-containing protein n=1 Tax=Trifolium subterraneum TaxID=3900 RepID=A0A2Z6LZQ5_TRISU|nr:hypothetical protein TSUD_157190 [Trifolium subterraneum]
MKERKGKRSEVFWPSIVMKKWLNIKQKVYDFSEDEADTETESEDDSMVTIGTWNVAGVLPCNDLDIEGWLCIQEPSDIYIIGFQEVVPLNAGNVLGAEDNKPISKWEEIIRRTLNKSFEPETEQKCYSAPPSPVRTNSSFNIQVNPLDIVDKDYFGTLDINDAEIKKKEEIKTMISIENNIALRKIYDTDLQTILDWPELPSDTIHHVDPNPKLRRVLSASDCASLYGYGMKRSHRSSGNLSLLWRENQQEIVPQVFDTFLELPIEKDVNGIVSVKSHPKKLRRHIHHLKVSQVGVGLMGYMGNKGSISVSMSVFQSRMCFVCSHLASGQKDGAEQRRNSDVHEIVQRTRFSSVLDIDQPQTISSHDQIFWFGDLNYRINMSDREVRKLISLRKWDELMDYDQLSNELCNGHVFEGWKEGLINFPPTYKCDRILWLGNGIKQLQYQCAENKLSDHRPVSSIFLVDVEVIDHRKLQRALNFASAVVHPEIFVQDNVNLSCYIP